MQQRDGRVKPGREGTVLGDIEQPARGTTPITTAARPPRIALVLPHLGVGGAQRVAATLANYWASEGWDVHLIATLSHKDDFYPLDPRVNRETLTRSRRPLLAKQ